MKNIFLFVFYFINTIIYCQNTISVDYEVFFQIDEKIESNDRIKELFDLANKGAKLGKFTLDICDNEANFYVDEYKGLQDIEWETTLSLSGYNSILYIDNKNQQIKSNNDDSFFKINSYLIVNDINSKWSISYQDTLNINGFKCFKATLLEEVKMQNNKISRNEVTAWFTPDLPFQFGPNGYGLLPGLILQLSSNRVNFYAKKLNFDKKIKIKKINEGVIISEVEFERLVYEKSKELKGLD